MPKKQTKAGGPTGTILMSPARAKRLAKQRRQEDQRWKSLNGPVTVRKVGPSKP